MTGPYRLLDADGKPYLSAQRGTLGGHRKNKIYGRLDCRGAARWIAKGHYVTQRVFFADEATAIAAGYRPCATCMPEQYRAWKTSTGTDEEPRPAGRDRTSERTKRHDFVTSDTGTCPAGQQARPRAQSSSPGGSRGV